jgi:anti-anti-sigma regulatory factor
MVTDGDVVVGGSLVPADVPRLAAGMRGVIAAGGCRTIACDVRALETVDLVTVDALAQLALAARRLGRSLGLVNASVELRDLVTLAGLEAVLPSATLVVEPRRKPEEWEEPRRVEEERDSADPAR